MDLCAVFVGHNRSLSGTSICTQHHTILINNSNNSCTSFSGSRRLKAALQKGRIAENIKVYVICEKQLQECIPTADNCRS